MFNMNARWLLPMSCHHVYSINKQTRVNINQIYLRYFAEATKKKNVVDSKTNKAKTEKSQTKKKSSGNVNKKKMKGGNDENKQETESMYNFFKAAEESKRIKLTYTDEEMIKNAAIAKRYQIESAKRHNLLSKDLTTKIWLQQQAIKALPTELLRVHALTIDPTPPPEGRPFPHWDTPPIKGFNPMEYIKKEKSEDGENEENEDREREDGSDEYGEES